MENSRILVQQLTARELQVLELMGKGLSNKQIAQALSISFETVKNHKKNIGRKLPIRNYLRFVHITLTQKVEQPSAK